MGVAFPQPNLSALKDWTQDLTNILEDIPLEYDSHWYNDLVIIIAVTSERKNQHYNVEMPFSKYGGKNNIFYIWDYISFDLG